MFLSLGLLLEHVQGLGLEHGIHGWCGGVIEKPSVVGVGGVAAKAAWLEFGGDSTHGTHAEEVVLGLDGLGGEGVHIVLHLVGVGGLVGGVEHA